jgi:curved DNA-binding protein CbpA
MVDTKLPTNSPLKDEATRHIEAKLRVLESWVLDGIPWQVNEVTGQSLLDANDEKVLDYFPTDIKAFALWDGNKNCSAVRAQLGPLYRCSRTTLDQKHHAVRRQQISDVMDALKSKAVSQLEKSSKSLTLTRQEAENNFLKKIVTRQEGDVVELTIKLHEATKNLRDEKDKHRRNRVQWKEEKDNLEAKISELTKTLRKLVPLKSRKPR